MGIEQQLYELNARDMKITPIDIYYRYSLETGAAFVLSADFDIPNDRILHLNRFSISATPQPGTSVCASTISVYDPIGQATVSEIGRKVSTIATGAPCWPITMPAAYSETVDLYIGPNMKIRMVVDFSSNVFAHQAWFSLCGMLFPRGNFAI